MDRRRYVPFPEGLETRKLLASVNLNTLFGLQVNSNLNVPITFQQKSLRIQRLPFYLDKIATHGRFLQRPRCSKSRHRSLTWSTASIARLSRLSTITTTSSAKWSPRQSLTTADIDRLNYSFGAVLHSAKAPRRFDQ